jgi:hypothetical protein
MQEAGRLVDEADLGALAAYFRDNPVRPYRRGAAALARAGGR